MSVFAAPVAAIRAGRSICEDARQLDIEVRAGVHTGECDRLRGGDLSGLAVHIAARVGAAAAPGEVWMSRTVCDLIGGSGLQVRSRGAHRLKDISEPWELFSAASENLAVTSIPEQPSPMRGSDRLILALADARPASSTASTASTAHGAAARTTSAEEPSDVS